MGGAGDAKSCSCCSFSQREAVDVITAAFLYKQNLGGLRICFLKAMHYLRSMPSPPLQVGHSQRVMGTEVSWTCSNGTTGTWIITRRRTTLVVTIASSSELASSSPNSSVSSWWKHGSRVFVYHARECLFTTGFCFSSRWFLQVLFVEALVEKPPGGMKTAHAGLRLHQEYSLLFTELKKKIWNSESGLSTHLSKYIRRKKQLAHSSWTSTPDADTDHGQHKKHLWAVDSWAQAWNDPPKAQKYPTLVAELSAGSQSFL